MAKAKATFKTNNVHEMPKVIKGVRPKGKPATANDPVPRPIIATMSGDSNKNTDFILAGSVKTETVEWLLPERLQAKAINIIEARKGMGKSSVLASIVAFYTNQRNLFGSDLKITKPNVLWVQHEESYESAVVPRMREFGANLSFVIVPKTGLALAKIVLPGGAEELAKLVREKGVGLVIIDPFSALADPKASQNDQGAMRYYMEMIKTACCDNGATVLMSRHLRKGTSGHIGDHGIGSSAVGNVARLILRLDNHPSKQGTKLLSVVATNSGRLAMPLAFELLDGDKQFPVLKWGSEQDMSLEEIMEGSQEEDVKDEKKDANMILINVLSDSPRWSKEILEHAKLCGISERTLRKAKARLKITSEHRFTEGTGERKLFWVLPDEFKRPAETVAALQPIPESP